MTHGQARSPMVFDRAFLTGVEDVTQIILVRHGEQYIADPRGGPFGETIDPPLSERGQRQALLVGMKFSTLHVDVVYASPLKRALETGRQIARHHRLEPVVLHDLREVEVFRDIPPDQSAVEFMGEHLRTGIRERMLHEKKWDVYPYSESSFEADPAGGGKLSLTLQGLRLSAATNGPPETVTAALLLPSIV